MKITASKGYIAYALTVLGYSDDEKIDFLGTYGCLLKEYLAKLGKKDNMQAKIMKEECRSIAKHTLRLFNISLYQTVRFNEELNKAFDSLSKESAREYFIKDKFLTYDDETDLDLLEDDDENPEIFIRSNPPQEANEILEENYYEKN